MFPAILKKEQAVVNATKKQLLIIDDKIAIARIITVYLSD